MICPCLKIRQVFIPSNVAKPGRRLSLLTDSASSQPQIAGQQQLYTVSHGIDDCCCNMHGCSSTDSFLQT